MKKDNLIQKRFLENISSKLGSEVVSYRRFKSGLANFVFLIKLKNKKEYVLKLYKKNNVSKYKNDIFILNFLSKNNFVPEIIYHGTYNDKKYLVMSKIQGKNMKESNLEDLTKNMNKILFDVGKISANLHKIKSNNFGKVYNPKYKTWESFLKNLNNNYLKKLEKTEFEYLIPKIKKYLDGNLYLVKGLKKPSFIHDDIQSENLIVYENKVNGIIDFDRAFFGDPLYEFPYLETSFLYFFNKKEKTIKDNLYKGYLSEKKIDWKRYEKLKDYYYLCKYLRHLSGFKYFEKVITKKLAATIKKSFLFEINKILNKRGDEMRMIDLKKHKKIFITGGPGTGKTTLAKELSKLTGIKHYRADRLAYSPDFQKKYSDKEKEKKLKELIKKRKWIIDGVYMAWMEKAYENADLIIILDLPRRIILCRVYKRSKKLIKETDKHTYKDMRYLLKKAYKYRKQTHKKFIDLIESKNKDYIILKNNRQLKRLLK